MGHSVQVCPNLVLLLTHTVPKVCPLNALTRSARSQHDRASLGKLCS